MPRSRTAPILWTHNGAGTLSNATSLVATYNPVASDAGNICDLDVDRYGQRQLRHDSGHEKDLTVTDEVTVFAGADSETCDNAFIW